MKKKPKLKTKMIRYRTPINKVTASLPFVPLACGWHTAQKGWTERNDGKYKNYAGLFWCSDGSGNFTINDDSYVLEAGQVLFFHFFDSHFIEILNTNCTYYWATFDGPLAMDLLTCLNYPKTPFYSQGDLKSYFVELYDTLYDLSPQGTLRGSKALYDLLTAVTHHVDADLPNHKYQNLAEQFIKLTDDNFGNANFNVNTAADTLQVHRSTLRNAVYSHVRLYPSIYIMNIRLQHGLKLLSDSNMKVAEIGAACGIPDPCYFSKLIKQLTGHPPSKLRRG